MLILTSSNNFVVKHYLPHLPREPKQIKLTFIPTAAEVEDGDLSWLGNDRQTLVDAGFQVTDFTVTGKNQSEVKSMLDSTDFVFVSGEIRFIFFKK